MTLRYLLDTSEQLELHEHDLRTGQDRHVLDLPLARGSDGRLGVVGAGGGGTAVTVNISTPDVESFRRSDAQISTALARAVARGQRGL